MRPPHPQHWHPHAAMIFLVPMLLAAVVVAGAGLAVAVSAVVILRLLPLLLIGGAAVAVAAHRRRRHRVRPGRIPSGPALPAAVRGSTPSWHATRARYGRLQQEFARYECDPLAVLQLPALADVAVSSTARFVDALAEAQALDSDTEPPERHREQFAAAVDRACRAWQAARDAADRIRLSRVPAAERATVERAIALLTLARDSGNDAERLAAYGRARVELAKLERSGTLRLPVPAAAALADAARGRLAAS